LVEEQWIRPAISSFLQKDQVVTCLQRRFVKKNYDLASQYRICEDQIYYATHGCSMVDITVVTAVGPYPHNTKWLPQCVESVWNQTVLPFEYIMVDDGANIGEIEGVRIIKLHKNIGIWGINKGIEQTRSDWVVLLSSDDMLGKYCIEWLSNGISDQLAINGGEPFLYRFPVFLSSQEIVIRNGICFHINVWKEVGGMPERNPSDVLFISSVLEGKYAVIDSDLYKEYGNPTQYYYHREHCDQWSKLNTR